MVIEPPVVLDAEGSSIPATLSVSGDVVTMTLSMGGGTHFPVTAETDVAAPPNAANAAKPPHVRFGLSDPKPSVFAKPVEGVLTKTLDPHLPSAQLPIGIARDVIPYNWHATNATLVAWLKSVKLAGLQPFITLTAEAAAFCRPRVPCHETSLISYEKHFNELVAGLQALHAREPSVIPAVTLWGAWNEPDLHTAKEVTPLYPNPKRAALFWKKARAILATHRCSCTLLAGEFAEYDGYIAKYESTIVKNHAFWSGKPQVWGLHDYHDLEYFYRHPHNSYAEAFLKALRRIGTPRVWLSEQGVALQNGTGATALLSGTEAEQLADQNVAAKTSRNWRKFTSPID